MGVSGVGKSTVGRLLAERLGWEFAEGDAFHPEANVQKMRAGMPLDDADRRPWLERLAGEVAGWLDAGRDVVLTCSALKRAYRDALRGGRDGVTLVYLHGPAELIHRRMEARRGHFMPPGLLASQLRDLEAPEPEEGALEADVEAPAQALVERLLPAIRELAE